jgi:predicted RND superfamily exporter protein
MNRRSDQYARWIDSRRHAILAAGGLLAAAGAALALQLPLRADFSNLLPPQERSVRDLERIEHRTQALGLVLVALSSPETARRSAAARSLAARIRAFDPALVADVVSDEGVGRRFAWDHRFLFAPLADLESARDSISGTIRRAKLRANPLFVSLTSAEEDARDAAQERAEIDRLRAQLREAEEKARQPSELISPDGKLQLLIVEAPFPSTSVPQGERLVAALDRAVAETVREIGPGVEIGLTEDVVIAVAEHRAILHGLTLAVVLTVGIVGVSLLLYFGSIPALAALFGSLAVGTLVAFGLARVTIGHLNSVTAFLSSIVVGNGINFGILVLARYLEARRRGEAGVRALSIALGGSFTGTLTAALAAGSAYASLIVTDFRGFRDFGVIGGGGMLLCWMSAYTVLPALLAVLERRRAIRVADEPALGRWLARFSPRRPVMVAAIGGAVVLVSALVTWRYLADDPYEYDWQRLRADSGMASDAHRWMAAIDRAFGRQLVGGFVIGAADRRQAESIERTLRAHAEDEPGAHAGDALFRRVGSIESFVPKDQEEKLRVLVEIRRLIDDKKLELLDPEELADLRRFRPADDLKPLARRFVERDGTRGRLLFANQASRFDGWNGRHMIAFADAVRALKLPDEMAVGGGAFVFADVLRAVTRAGPRATLAALLGVVLFVVVVVGRKRHVIATLASVVAGTTVMIACAALLGLKVNFLDFVALPITLGISVDYAVNVVARDDGPAEHPTDLATDLGQALATTGGSVVLCSWTTIVGYGSLLLSANAGIRSFGAVAILGEATCLLAALTLAPALLALMTPRAPSHVSRHPGSS